MKSYKTLESSHSAPFPLSINSFLHPHSPVEGIYSLFVDAAFAQLLQLSDVGPLHP